MKIVKDFNGLVKLYLEKVEKYGKRRFMVWRRGCDIKE